jgi:hypothetical protein
MKTLPAFLFLSITLVPPAALAKKAAADYPAKYAGGSLPLDHHKVRATLAKDEIIFMQGDQRIAVPVKSITGISCGTEVRRRLGAWALDVVPLMHLGESSDHYVGVAWSGASSLEVEPRRISRLSRCAGAGDRHQGGQYQSSADRSPLRDLTPARFRMRRIGDNEVRR